MVNTQRGDHLYSRWWGFWAEKMLRKALAVYWKVTGAKSVETMFAKGNEPMKSLKEKLQFEQVPPSSTPYSKITHLLYSLLAKTEFSFS